MTPTLGTDPTRTTDRRQPLGSRSVPWLAAAVAALVIAPTVPAFAAPSESRTTTVAAAAADTTAPTAPVLTVVLGGTTAGLTWTTSTDNVGVTGYLVYRNGVFHTDSLNPFYDGTNLAAGTYTYAVVATDAAGNVSARSNSVTVTVAAAPLVDTTPPSVPGTPTTTVVGSTVGLHWGISSDDTAVAGYRVTRNGTVLGTTNDTTWSDLGLTTGTYSYTVVAFDAAGNTSASSGAGSATVAAPTPLAFITPSRLPDATRRQPYLAFIVADDPPGPSSFTFRVVSGRVPAGTRFVANNLPTRPEARVIGTPTARGTSTFTVEVTDGAGATARRTFTVRVV
jgi:Putative Ig domain